MFCVVVASAKILVTQQWLFVSSQQGDPIVA
uniref:Uncharacterized protein n=1 Tax=Arundo donax TaxID=35708 RepID=A0A0A8YZF3_ARUDO